MLRSVLRSSAASSPLAADAQRRAQRPIGGAEPLEKREQIALRAGTLRPAAPTGRRAARCAISDAMISR